MSEENVTPENQEKEYTITIEPKTILFHFSKLYKLKNISVNMRINQITDKSVIIFKKNNKFIRFCLRRVKNVTISLSYFNETKKCCNFARL